MRTLFLSEEVLCKIRKKTLKNYVYPLDVVKKYDVETYSSSNAAAPEPEEREQLKDITQYKLVDH